MPEVVVYALSGRSAEQKQRLTQAITDAVAEHFEVPTGRIVVRIVESDPGPKPKDALSRSERQAR
jgi:4-oxalocrotonate tautomerase